jgi:thiol:disulfide interchange protein DsbA
MKKIILLVCAMIMQPVSAWAAQYQEGEHYTVVSERATSKPELREYFSYYCPACRSFESYLSDFKKALPTGASFEKTHVDFMGHTSAEVQFMLGKALVVAEKTGVAKTFSPAMFNYLQTQRATISTEKDIKNVFVLNGGDGDKFDKAFNNFSIVSQAKRNKKVQDKLNKARHLKSVPTFVVNGKYLINSQSLDQKNFIADYQNLIGYLFTLK